MKNLQGVAIVGKDEAWRKSVTKLVKSEGADILYSGEDDELVRILVLAGEVDHVVFTDSDTLFAHWYEPLKTAIQENGHSMVHTPPKQEAEELPPQQVEAHLVEGESSSSLLT